MFRRLSLLPILTRLSILSTTPLQNRHTTMAGSTTPGDNFCLLCKCNSNYNASIAIFQIRPSQTFISLSTAPLLTAPMTFETAMLFFDIAPSSTSGTLSLTASPSHSTPGTPNFPVHDIQMSDAELSAIKELSVAWVPGTAILVAMS